LLGGDRASRHRGVPLDLEALGALGLLALLLLLGAQLAGFAVLVAVVMTVVIAVLVTVVLIVFVGSASLIAVLVLIGFGTFGSDRVHHRELGHDGDGGGTRGGEGIEEDGERRPVVEARTVAQVDGLNLAASNGHLDR